MSQTSEIQKAEQDSRSQQTTIQVQPNQRGLSLRSLDDMWRFAQCLVKSGLAPKGLDKPEAALVALQAGAEIGLPPMASIQNIAVINGRPSLWGDAMLAVCMQSPDWEPEPFKEWIEGEGDKMVAHCRVGRRGVKEPIIGSFSASEAIKAELWTKSGPWKQYPRRMLAMRARAFALRNAFADALRGIACREEVEDYPEPVQVESMSYKPAQSRASDIVNRLTGGAAPQVDSEQATADALFESEAVSNG